MSNEIDIKKLSDLVRLNISEEESQKFQSKLSATIDYINQLMEVDVSNVEPMSHVHGINNVMREDEPKNTLTLDDLKSIAPELNGSFIKVPLVIE